MSNSLIKKSGDLTKRERFAMHAMQGYIAREEDSPENTALAAVMAADALIEELEKKKYKS